MEASQSKTENLQSLSKEELIEKITNLNAHNEQLKNLLNKKNEETVNRYLRQKPKPFQKPYNFSKAHFRHVLLKFYYFGWEYDGYVVQEDTLKTIEHIIFEALKKTCFIKDRESSNYHRCGRTDKGVSSFSQVISLDIRSKFPKDVQEVNKEKEINYCQALNRVLPQSIQFTAWCPVPDNTSARFDCKSRTYKYFFPKSCLFIDDMSKGLLYLIGSHDFRNLCKMDVGNGVVSFQRTIINAAIDKCKDSTNANSEYDMYQVTITSQAFLWHQIRCIMAVIFLIGQGKERPEIIKELLDIKKNPRKPEYCIASETGLNLFCCEYELSNEWIYNNNNLESVIKKMYNSWSTFETKSIMIKSMLNELEKIYQENSNNSINYNENPAYLPVMSKWYKPLMERQKCGALEDRIKHYVKKRKIRAVQDVEDMI